MGHLDRNTKFHDVKVQKKLYMTRTDRMTECFLLSTRVDTLLKA